jgi:hypothetical protein
MVQTILTELEQIVGRRVAVVAIAIEVQESPTVTALVMKQTIVGEPEDWLRARVGLGATPDQGRALRAVQASPPL